MATRKKTTQPSSYISDPEKLKLWVRSGGRCAFCNRYLLRDELTAQWLNLAEMAHNVGRKRSERSPRGLDPLPMNQRNLAENLLLLCSDHHTLIDDRVKSGQYDIEYLKQVKHTHEARIEYVTSLGVDRETTVIRIIGDIRGSAPDVSAETVRQVVLNSGRYPRFPLAYDGQDLEIDLRHLPGEATALYWEAGRQRIDDALNQRLGEGARKGAVRHLSIFALARIPLLVYFGYQLDDKIPTDLYQKHRDEHEGWAWDEQAQPVQFAYEQTQAGTDLSKVAVVLSVSGTIDVQELPADLRTNHAIYTLMPADGEIPQRDIIRTQASLGNFARSFQLLLSELETTHKQAEIHLFAAVPVSAAVACGRSIMREAHPSVVVYDRSGSEYVIALEVNQR